MRIVNFSTLRAFWENDNPAAEQALRAWFAEVRRARWKRPDDIMIQFPRARIIPGNRVVFHIHGNDYRLVVAVKYPFSLVRIRFIGIHKDYDKIDATRI